MADKAKGAVAGLIGAKSVPLEKAVSNHARIGPPPLRVNPAPTPVASLTPPATPPAQQPPKSSRDS